MEAQSRSQGPARVLVVDDEPTLRRLLRVVLESGGFDVLEAESIAAAMEWLANRSNLPDVVVLDLVLANGEGVAFLRYLRQHPVLRSLPVAIVTGRVSDADRAHVLGAGADVLIPKPFSAIRLRQIVRQLASEGRPVSRDRADREIGHGA